MQDIYYSPPPLLTWHHPVHVDACLRGPFLITSNFCWNLLSLPFLLRKLMYVTWVIFVLQCFYFIFFSFHLRMRTTFLFLNFLWVRLADYKNLYLLKWCCLIHIIIYVSLESWIFYNCLYLEVLPSWRIYILLSQIIILFIIKNTYFFRDVWCLLPINE